MSPCAASTFARASSQFLSPWATAASAADAKLDVVIPYQRGDLVSLAHERCHIISESHEADGTHIQMLAAPAFAAAFREFSA